MGKFTWVSWQISDYVA